MNATIKESFLLYASFWEPIQSLSMTERGELLTAVYEYQINRKISKLSPAPNMAFSFIKTILDRDAIKYESICNRNRTNGQKGGRPKNPNKPDGYLTNPSKPKKADNDNDNDNDKDIQLFADFWKIYPLRNGKKTGKAKTEKLFNKFREEKQKQIITAVKNYAASGQMPKDPERFLKDDYWQDWLTPAKPGAQNTSKASLEPMQEFGGINAA